MKIDLNTYKANRKYIQNFYKENKDKYSNVVHMISLIAPSIHCPNLVLSFYLAEMIGFIPELTKSIEHLIEQNSYTEILNQPENSPFDKQGKIVV